MTGDGINVSSPIGVPTVSGNTVTNAAADAINILNASVDMGALNGNSGSGNGLNGVQFSQDVVTVSSSLPWSGNLVPVMSSGCSALTVPAERDVDLRRGHDHQGPVQQLRVLQRAGVAGRDRDGGEPGDA